MNEPIQYDVTGGVATIHINRPEVSNAIDPTTLDSLAGAYHTAEHDEEVRAVVLAGVGEDFSVGLDPVAFLPVLQQRRFSTDGPGRINPFGTTTRLSKPLVAAVHGTVGAMANELILAADVRIAAAGTSFSQAEPSRGATPAGGATVRLTLEVGWANAMRWILTGDDWGAEDALRMGLVQEVVPAGEQVTRAVAIAGRIASHPPKAVRETLRIGRRAWEGHAHAVFGDMLPALYALLGSEDFAERQAAMREGREPSYTGR